MGSLSIKNRVHSLIFHQAHITLQLLLKEISFCATFYWGPYRFLGFTSQPSRHFTKVTDSPGEISVFAGSWAQNVNL